MPEILTGEKFIIKNEHTCRPPAGEAGTGRLCIMRQKKHTTETKDLSK